MSKRPHAPRKKNQQTPTPQDNTEKEADTAPGQPPLITNVPPATPNCTESNKRKDGPAHWWRTWGTWKRVLEVAAAISVVVYAALTYLQWHDLRHNFEVDQRAWIKVTYTFSDVPSVAEYTPVHLNRSNVGKSPAIREEIQYVVEFVRTDKGPSLVLSGPKVGHATALFDFPGDTYSPPAFLFDSKGFRRGITQAEVESLRRGDTYISVFGLIIYTDQFGTHWSRFCGWRGYAARNFEAETCTLWNAAGDGDRPK